MVSQPTRILLIEPDAHDFLVTKDLLLEDESVSYNIAWAKNLKEALSCLKNGDLDVVLAALELEDSHGVNTYVSLQAGRPQMPIVLLAGRDDERLAGECISRGAQDFLIKGDTDGDALNRAISFAIIRSAHQRGLM